MKKIQFLIIALIGAIASVNANPVDVNVAEKTAENFYASMHSSVVPNLSLAYTERDANGEPVYYVFNVNGDTKGFVIISADDAASPIIGYSDESSFVIPTNSVNNVYFWLQNRKNEIIAMRAHNIAATSGITSEWTSYASNTKRITHNAASASLLCKTYWNQSPFYNAYCPGGSVTGCVATAMAQIMKYWAYPSVGTSSHCYNDSRSRGFSENYGQLCAEFDTSHYVWSAMPDNPLGDTNTQIAELMYDCGVSVDMDYAPTGSGAQVMNGPASAFNSYTAYFGYDPNTINTAYYDSYTDSTWIALLENEFNYGRPVQFQGFDVSEGGHSWVGDGYNNTNMIHMNWGWGGSDNGYYYMNKLNPTPFSFTYGIAVIYGIEPPNVLAVKQVSDIAASISVYPNPSHGVFNFTLPGNTGTYKVEVYNVLGQEVNNALISSSHNEINLSAQPKGIYIYKIIDETGTPLSTGRLVVE